jgi:hypothetical protein
MTPLFTIILKSIHELYIALHQRTIAPLTAFSAITDPVLDDATSYPVCTISEHRFLTTPGFPLDEPYPETTGHTPHAIPGQDPKIPALSHVLRSHIFPNFEAVATPSSRSWSPDTSDDLAHTPKTMPMPSLDPEEPVPQIHKFNGYGGQLSGLLYHSPHTVLYEDELYPRALALV